MITTTIKALELLDRISSNQSEDYREDAATAAALLRWDGCLTAIGESLDQLAAVERAPGETDASLRSRAITAHRARFQ